MSRVQKYRESLQRFIKDKSCLYSDCEEELNNFIYKKIKESDFLFSILLLTVMNHNNKKNHVAPHGYFFASCIEFFNSMVYIIENKKDVITKLGDEKYFKLYNNLYYSINKSLQQNIESIKGQSNSLLNVIVSALNIHNKTFKVLNNITDVKFIIVNKGCSGNIIKWYLKNDNARIEKFKKLRRITKDSMSTYIEKKYQTVCELAISLGWIMGGGDLSSVSKVVKIAKHMAIMYKISLDYRNLDQDLDAVNKDSKELYTTNFVLNYGLEESYGTFLQNKEKFIEESMTHKIYTTTIKEIIDSLEHCIDIVVEKSSPDLKSSYSSYSTQRLDLT